MNLSFDEKYNVKVLPNKNTFTPFMVAEMFYFIHFNIIQDQAKHLRVKIF